METQAARPRNRKHKRIDWYWDVRLWAPVLLILCLNISQCSSRTVKQVDAVDDTSSPTVASEHTEVTVEPTEETTPALDKDAVALARLADSTAAGRSDAVKEIIMWIVINRVEDRSHGYGGTLESELARPSQWQCYDPTSYYLESTYDLALEVLNTWRNGGPRPIYNDMLWFVFNGDGSITIRNQFKATKNRREQVFE